MNWTQLNIEESEIAPSNFGLSQAITSKGDFIAVTDDKFSDVYDEDIGGLYIYKLNETTYDLFQRIIGSNDRIGLDIDISDNGFIVSLDNESNNIVRIYKLNDDETEYTLFQTIDQIDINGKTISISQDGSRFIVGNIDNKEILVFDSQNNQYELTGVISDDSINFGKIISLSGNGEIIFVNVFINDNSFIRAYQENDELFDQAGQDVLFSNNNTEFIMAPNFDGDRFIVGNHNTNTTSVYELVAGKWRILGKEIEGSNRTAGISNEGNRIIISNYDKIQFLEYNGEWIIQNEFGLIEEANTIGDEVTINGDGTLASSNAFDSDFNIGNVIFYSFPKPERKKFVIFTRLDGKDEIVDENAGLDVLIGTYVNGIGCNPKLYRVKNNIDILKLFKH